MLPTDADTDLFVCARCGRVIERRGEWWVDADLGLPYCEKKPSADALALLHAPLGPE